MLNYADCNLDFDTTSNGLQASTLHEQMVAYCLSGVRGISTGGGILSKRPHHVWHPAWPTGITHSLMIQQPQKFQTLVFELIDVMFQTNIPAIRAKIEGLGIVLCLELIYDHMPLVGELLNFEGFNRLSWRQGHCKICFQAVLAQSSHGRTR